MNVQYNLAFHELSQIVPLMEGEALEELVADIKERGQIEPIVLLDGQILDGRNRYRACVQLGIEPSIAHYNGHGNPLDYVVSRNIKRRHLSPSQKAMAAEKIANLKHGGDRGNQYTGGKGSRDLLPNGSDAAEPTSMAEAAKLVGVGEATVKRARFVVEHGTPEQVAAVKTGELTVATAVKQIREPIGLPPNTTLVQPRRQRLARGEKKARDRLERFMKVTDGIGFACEELLGMGETERTFLSRDVVAERITYLKRARRDLSKLITRLEAIEAVALIEEAKEQTNENAN